MKVRSIVIVFGVALLVLLMMILGKNRSYESDRGASRPTKSADMSDNRTGESGRDKELREIIEGDNVSILFYGRVVDEGGVGMDGVIVKYFVQRGGYLSGLIKSYRDLGEVVSGSDGRFQISGLRGWSLSVGPLAKEGYRDPRGDARGFGYARTPEPHEADIGNPIVFVMIKSGIPSAEEIYSERLRLSWNSGEVHFPLGYDLGSLELTPTRNMPPGRTSPARRDPFTWSMAIAMEGAELVPIKLDGMSVIAPESGYLDGLEFRYDVDAPNWSPILRECFVFRTKKGQYGLIELEVPAVNEYVGVGGRLTVRLNKSGHRNLD